MGRKINVFERIKAFRRLIHTTLPGTSDSEIRLALDRVHRFQRGLRKTPLTEQEKIIADLLIRNNLVAQQVFRWFYMLTFDKDIQDDLKYQRIGIKRAMKEMKKRRKETKETLEAEILDDIKSYISDLRRADKNKILRGVQNEN